MTETKLFHIGDVLTITSGKLVSPDHIGGVYNICGWMTGESLFTHQLSRVSRECDAPLRKQLPDLAAVEVPAGLNSEQKVKDFLEMLYPKFGQFVPVAKLEEGDHTEIDPFEELRMMRPDAEIIAVSVDDDKP